MQKSKRPPISQCRLCRGFCCKKYPGICAPEDIKKLFPAATLHESVGKAITSKKFVIDNWETSQGILYFIRPEIANEDEGITYDCTGRHCIFLTDEGCKLGENKPLECRLLIPRKHVDASCISKLKHYAKELFGRLWRRHIDLGNFEYAS